MFRNRTYLSKIEFCLSDFSIEPPELDSDDWESFRAELYKENDDEYIYIKRENLETLLDEHSVSIHMEADLNVDVEDSLGLDTVDNININFE